jgi:5-(carboxyamino)imidazole ribonucleotide mutase
VPAVVDRHRPARQEGRQQIERAAVIEPPVQQHGNRAFFRPALTDAQGEAAHRHVAFAEVHAGICPPARRGVKRLDRTPVLCYPPRMPGKPLVGIIMGSKTDLEVLQGAVEVLREFGIEHELRILSAHRTPEKVLEWSQTAEERGLEVLIAGAGSAAALPGVVAAKTVLPVLGVPVASTTLGGVDALLSIVQMPKGVPVGTLAIGKGGAANAALLAVSILAASRPDLREKLRAWRKKRADEVLKSDAEAQGK